MLRIERTVQKIEEALRELVAAIYNDCYGAYGGDARYQGQYEEQIHACAQAMAEEISRDEDSS